MEVIKVPIVIEIVLGAAVEGPLVMTDEFPFL